MRNVTHELQNSSTTDTLYRPTYNEPRHVLGSPAERGTNLGPVRSDNEGEIKDIPRRSQWKYKEGVFCLLKFKTRTHPMQEGVPKISETQNVLIFRTVLFF
jgi:hypothetical protein